MVTEFWGEHNLYCPNCSSASLDRLKHNTQASDFSCPKCKFWFQLKGQKSRIGNSITDGAYSSMMHAIQNDETPNFYFLHYDLATWTIKNLLLVPSFAFPPSAIIKRPPLSPTARRAGWVGCNFDLRRIPAEARIPLITTGGARCPSEPRRGTETAPYLEAKTLSPPPALSTTPPATNTSSNPLATNPPAPLISRHSPTLRLCDFPGNEFRGSTTFQFFPKIQPENIVPTKQLNANGSFIWG